MIEINQCECTLAYEMHRTCKIYSGSEYSFDADLPSNDIRDIWPIFEFEVQNKIHLVKKIHHFFLAEILAAYQTMRFSFSF